MQSSFSWLLFVCAAAEGALAYKLSKTSLLAATSLAQAALCSAAVGVAAESRLTSWYGKDPRTGRFHWWSYVLFWPYHTMYRANVYLRRAVVRSEPIISEIHPGWHVAGWLSSDEVLRRHGLTPAAVSVIDCTVELPKRVSMPTLQYLNLPMWDTTAPSPADLDRAVQWALKRRAAGDDVVVHCAFGHGRSATVLASALLSSGAFHADIDSTHRHMKTKRPHLGMSTRQQRALRHWFDDPTKPQKQPHHHHSNGSTSRSHGDVDREQIPPTSSSRKSD